jgi:predicted nucleic acid-binding protein
VALLIDTSVVVAWERRTESLEHLYADEDRLLSVITVSELLHGVHRTTGRACVRRLAFVEHLLASFDAVPITKPIARLHAEAGAALAARGDAIPTHDLWIAATALTHGFGVATLDGRDFARVPGLRVVTP